ncbi:hypothetical protein vBValSX1_81 [Vibrio phage vB_ValS_X1]|uniref:Uncharacterized protein n=1 Tax=Vibrio phage vB_ValS_X1 TaxID=2736341 RepID=A0A6M9Z9I5_9CAUD|nr:hypothetical protein vBValSX1_81 [Vibrio phage vB_ValS_X1]
MDLLINVLLVTKPVLGLLLLLVLVLCGCKYFKVELPYAKILKGSGVVALLASIAMVAFSPITQPTTQVYDNTRDLQAMEAKIDRMEAPSLDSFTSKEATLTLESIQNEHSNAYDEALEEIEKFEIN